MNRANKFSFQKPFSLFKQTTIVSSVVAIVAGFLTALLVLIFTSKDLVFGIKSFFLGPFSSLFYFANWLNLAALVTFSALGVTIAQKSGNLNLGGEGQIYFSGFLTALLLPKFAFFTPVFSLITVAIIISSATGLVGMFSGLLKVYRKSNEILTTFLFSVSLIPLVDYGVIVFKDPSKNLLALPILNEKLRLQALFNPSQFNISFFFAIVLVIIVWYFFSKTRFGYIVRINGIAPEFGYFSGFSPNKTSVLALFFSAAFHGLTGFFAVVGTYYTCYNGFYAGLGWNALTASLIARSNPIAVFPASLLMAFLLASANYASLTNTITTDVTNIISAVMLVCVTAQILGRKKGAP